MKMNGRNIVALFAVGGLLAGSQALPAQDSTNSPPAGGPPPSQARMMRQPNIDRMVQRLTLQLNLTDDQQTKVKAILADQFQQMNMVRTNTSLTVQDQRSKIMGIRGKSMNQLKAVLTQDQFAQFLHMRQRGPRPNPGDTNAPPAAPPAPPQQ